jgi:hypothetical protein
VLTGTLIVMVLVLTEQYRSLQKHVAAPAALYHCVNKMGVVEISKIGKCRKDLDACRDARKTCDSHLRALTNLGIPWFATLHDADFDICVSKHVDDLYRRELKALGLKTIKAASADQAKVMRENMHRRAKTWNPEDTTGLPLNLTVYREMTKRYKVFDKRMTEMLEAEEPQPIMPESGKPQEPRAAKERQGQGMKRIGSSWKKVKVLWTPPGDGRSS